MNQTYLERFAELSLSGVDFDQDGLGGLECKFHVSTQSRIVETILGVLCAVVSIKLGLETKTHDGTTTQFRTHPDHRGYGRAVSLVLLTFVFGIEVGFKLVSRTLIFLLFPCHIVTVVWIYLLATPPSTFNNNIYRCVLHYWHGTILALLFPVVDVLQLPFEQEIYWTQHTLILCIPVYLILCENRAVFSPPPIESPSSLVSWRYVYLSYGFWALYHWVVMQGVSVITLANVGHMLCAAVSDPLAGPYYRVIGIAHQFLATTLSGAAVGLLDKLMIAHTQSEKESNEKK